jgi:predicted transposase
VFTAVKAVKQNYEPRNEVLDLLQTFRKMVNEAIRIGLENNISSRFKLSSEVYHKFGNTLHTWYRLSAIEKASAILKNYRREKRRILASSDLTYGKLSHASETRPS